LLSSNCHLYDLAGDDARDQTLQAPPTARRHALVRRNAEWQAGAK
jgi:hypothetical protein